MSTPKTQVELLRMEWVTKLRSEGHRKCTQNYRVARTRNDGLVVQVCAMGLLEEICMARDPSCFGDMDKTCRLAGLDTYDHDTVVHWNDFHELSFAQIADRLEERFAAKVVPQWSW